MTTAAEKDVLHASLDRHRDVMLWKLEGLDDDQLRCPMVPSGTNLLGLVKHLASIEFGWFCASFGRVIAEYDLDQEAQPPDGLWGEPVTLRWILVNVLEDTARDAGHADIVRELIDGTTGFWH